MQCDYFDAGRCRSCTRMGEPYARQLAEKTRRLHGLLDPILDGGEGEDPGWLEPVTSPESGFRNKAKMVVGGTAAEPTLGILDRRGRGVDLTECGLYPPEILEVLPLLRDIVRELGLTPYDVPARRGELKHIIVTVSPDGELMIRFVLRSKKHLVALRDFLPELRRRIPSARVVSINLLREHQALLEGPEEIVLTPESTLTMRLNGIPLNLRPQGFFQTNSGIAAAMYRQAAEWIGDRGARSVWDLYCGVGGFALHAARTAGVGRVTGLEISEQAIAAAQQTARELDLPAVEFRAGDAADIALSGREAQLPEVLVVNPPRRGIGPDLAAWIQDSAIPAVVYSSCHAVSLARDLALMPDYRVRRVRLFDMFPQTDHYETMVLLERRPA